MYPAIETIISGQGQNHPDRTRPLILCEYSHAMATVTARSPITGTPLKNIRLQGGFIWNGRSWLKQKPKTAGYWAYGGDFGDQPNDLNFVCDGLVCRIARLIRVSTNSSTSPSRQSDRLQRQKRPA